MIRELLEQFEDARLRPYAARASQSRGRRIAEEEDRYRTCFQRDRDRVIYSTAFRRLKYKTQVYVVHEGDFYRTRLTHTLEVMQHSRTVARALFVNEDLAEAIAYAHDLGHAPFGHAGERGLASLMEGWGGFDHNLQGLRIVDELEERYTAFHGLNLCFETREGIVRHSTPYDDAGTGIPEEFRGSRWPGIEAQMVNFADQLAWCTHDLEDALRAGVVTEEELRSYGPAWVVEFLDRPRSGQRAGGGKAEQDKKRKMLTRDLIEVFTVDLIEQVEKRAAEYRVGSPEDVRQLEVPLVDMSPERMREFGELCRFLHTHVYENPAVLAMAEKGRRVMAALFEVFLDNPRLLPAVTQEKYHLCDNECWKRRVVCDYISGMTENHLISLYRALFDPGERILGTNPLA